MIDKKTSYLSLPLPHAENGLAEDCPRLAQALTSLDDHASPVDSQISDAQTRLQPLDAEAMYDILDAKAKTLESTESGELSVSIKLVESMITAAVLERSKKEHPVGSYYTSDKDTEPSKIFGFGTWERVKGVVLLGADEETYPAGSEGGEASHQLTVDELPQHTHRVSIFTGGSDDSGDYDTRFFSPEGHSTTVSGENAKIYHTWKSAANKTWGLNNGVYGTGDPAGNALITGGNAEHNNMMPYHAAYCWRRTA